MQWRPLERELNLYMLLAACGNWVLPEQSLPLFCFLVVMEYWELTCMCIELCKSLRSLSLWHKRATRKTWTVLYMFALLLAYFLATFVVALTFCRNWDVQMRWAIETNKFPTLVWTPPSPEWTILESLHLLCPFCSPNFLLLHLFLQFSIQRDTSNNI